MKKSILIVDDDENVLNALIWILKTEDYLIETSLSGTILLEKMFYHPDLIILDKQLSGLDGAEICKHLKEQKATKDIPVILISATPDLENIAKNVNANDFIEKPFEICELLDKVRRII